MDLDTTVRLRVLGELAATRDGAVVDLGGRRQRAVLAALVIRRDQVVPADRLAACVWGESPPANPAGALQAYVSHLRRRLQPEAVARRRDGVIASQAAGYVLRLPPDAVDAWCFERAVDTAAGLAPADAMRTLDDALRLWHGPAYAEYQGEPWVEAEVLRLDELRAVARERLLETRLQLGDAAVVIGELEALVAEDPLREERWRLLALALYRAQRQAGALEALRRARETLADELGVDPGPALRALEAEVLAQSPALDAPAPARERRPAGRGGRGRAGRRGAGGTGRPRRPRPGGRGPAPDGGGAGRRQAGVRARRGAGRHRQVAAPGRGRAAGHRRAGAGALGAGQPPRARPTASVRCASCSRAARATRRPARGCSRGPPPRRDRCSRRWPGRRDRPRQLRRAPRPVLADRQPRHRRARCCSASTTSSGATARRCATSPTSSSAWRDCACSSCSPCAPASSTPTTPCSPTSPSTPRSSCSARRRCPRDAAAALVRERLGEGADPFVEACHRMTSGNPLLLRQLLRALADEGVRPDVSHVDTVRAVGSRAVSALVTLRLRRMPPTRDGGGARGRRAGRGRGPADRGRPGPRARARGGHRPRRAQPQRDPHPRRAAPVLRAPVGARRRLRRPPRRRARAAPRTGRRGAARRRAPPPSRWPGTCCEHPAGAVPPRSRCCARRPRTAISRGASEAAAGLLRRALEEPASGPERIDLLVELGRVETHVDGPSGVAHLADAYAALDEPRERALLAMDIARTHVFVSPPGVATSFARSAAASLPDGLDDERQGLLALQRMTGFMHGLPADGLPRRSAAAGLRRGRRGAHAGRDAVLRAAARGGGPRGRRPRWPASRSRATGCSRSTTACCGSSPPTCCSSRTTSSGDFWDRALTRAHATGGLFAALSVNLWRGFAQWRRGQLDDALQSLTDAVGATARVGAVRQPPPRMPPPSRSGC